MIQSELVVPIASIILTITALTLLLIQDWRISLIILALQYISVFILVSSTWPLTMAVTKLIAGWISAAVLGMAISSNADLRYQLSFNGNKVSEAGDTYHQHRFTGGLGIAFRILTSGLVALTIASQMEVITKFLPKIAPVYAWSGLILIGYGLIKLGFTFTHFHVLLALLTALSGFEILYAILEPSVISAGLFAAVNLALALIGAYLLTAPYMEEDA